MKGLLLYADRVTLLGSPLGNAIDEVLIVSNWFAVQQVDAHRAPPPEGFIDHLFETATDAERMSAISALWPEMTDEAVRLYEAVRYGRETRLARSHGLVRTVGDLANETPDFAPILAKLRSCQRS